MEAVEQWMASYQLTQDGERSRSPAISVQTHHKHQAALCQLQPQPRGPVKGRFQTFAEALA